MKILVACEESQRVTMAFRELGHEAYSCDILPTSGSHPEWHIQGNVLHHLCIQWDLLIAFPPCTYLSNIGNAWFNIEKYGEKAVLRRKLRYEAFNFFMSLITAPIERIVVENPVGYPNSHYRRPDQIIHPWMFGDRENKRTCLWLKNLPKLTPTKIVEPRVHGFFKSGPRKGKKIYFTESIGRHKDRGLLRSKTFPGIAKAMATQWSTLERQQLSLF